MEKEICNVICVEKEQNRNAVIELTEGEDSVTIKFSLGKLLLKKVGDNYFDTLIKIREELEKSNIKLLCKGCCKNVYPSGMLLCMGAGRNAYTLIYGEQAKMDSLVDIFASCSVDEYGCFSNFAHYDFELDGKRWMTSEHYFQAQKFFGTEYEEVIRLLDNPMKAAEMGRNRNLPLREDWEQVKDDIMRRAVCAKFTQNKEIRDILISTGKETSIT